MHTSSVINTGFDGFYGCPSIICIQSFGITIRSRSINPKRKYCANGAPNFTVTRFRRIGKHFTLRTVRLKRTIGNGISYRRFAFTNTYGEITVILRLWLKINVRDVNEYRRLDINHERIRKRSWSVYYKRRKQKNTIRFGDPIRRLNVFPTFNRFVNIFRSCTEKVLTRVIREKKNDNLYTARELLRTTIVI